MKRVKQLLILAVAVSVSLNLGAAVTAPSVGANPYPKCSPTVDPYCFFLWAMHEEFPGGLPDSDQILIIAANDACRWMQKQKSRSTYPPGGNAISPVFDYADALGRKHPEWVREGFPDYEEKVDPSQPLRGGLTGDGTRIEWDFATAFAMMAATAFCPDMH